MPKDTIKPEIEIRGITLKISITIESVLVRIIFFTNGDMYKEKKSEYLNTQIPFGEKLGRLRELLKKHHPDLAKRNRNLFNRLDKFITFRNHLCHAMLTWKDKKPDTFIIWDIKKDANKNEIFKQIDYNYNERFKYLHETLQMVMPKLAILSDEVQLRLKNSHPRIFQTIYEEYKRQSESEV
jgi:hypothetical protein